jgi:hypothetical protein
LKKDEDSLTSEFQSIGFQANGKAIVLTKGVTNKEVDNIYKSDFSERTTNLLSFSISLQRLSAVVLSSVL